jgi:hypothetical protein
VAEFFTNYLNSVIIRVIVNHHNLDIWVILRGNGIQTVPNIALAVISDDEAAYKRRLLVREKPPEARRDIMVRYYDGLGIAVLPIPGDGQGSFQG